MSKVTINRGSMERQQVDSRGFRRIGKSERIVSMIAGVTLASSAMRSRSLVSAALLLGGSAGQLHRGATGKCSFAKGISSINSMLNSCCDEIANRTDQKPDQVSAQSDDSFPASDSPSFTPVTGEGGHVASHMNK